MNNVAHLMVNVFDGTRQLIDQNVDLLITIFNGFQDQVFSGFRKGPSIDFTLPFFDNLGDKYRVIVSGDGYVQAGFSPINVSPAVHQSLDVMLLPKQSHFNFHDATWLRLKKTHPQIRALLAQGAADEQSAQERYENLLEGQAPALACLLNITTALGEIDLPVGSPLDYLKTLLWDDTMQADRFFAYADPELLRQVLLATTHGEFAPSATLLHPGATRSFKQVQFGEANVELTFHENDLQRIDGVDCLKVEVDMDYFKDMGAHFLLEVLGNFLRGALTDPRTVYVLRWMAGRRAGVPEFNPPYNITA